MNVSYFHKYRYGAGVQLSPGPSSMKSFVAVFDLIDQNISSTCGELSVLVSTLENVSRHTGEGERMTAITSANLMASS